jgi:hypothetical protein
VGGLKGVDIDAAPSGVKLGFEVVKVGLNEVGIVTDQ